MWFKIVGLLDQNRSLEIVLNIWKNVVCVQGDFLKCDERVDYLVSGVIFLD